MSSLDLWTEKLRTIHKVATLVHFKKWPFLRVFLTLCICSSKFFWADILVRARGETLGSISHPFVFPTNIWSRLGLRWWVLSSSPREEASSLSILVSLNTVGDQTRTLWGAFSTYSKTRPWKSLGNVVKISRKSLLENHKNWSHSLITYIIRK